MADRLLDSRLQHITLSFDGASKPEHYQRRASKRSAIRALARETRTSRQLNRCADGSDGGQRTEVDDFKSSGARCRVSTGTREGDETNLVTPERARSSRAARAIT
jgi:hypothetical protein